MKLEINRIYKTQNGRYLRLDSIGDLLYFFTLVNINGEVIPEQRNRFGHVVVRSKLTYTRETVDSFKLKR